MLICSAIIYAKINRLIKLNFWNDLWKSGGFNIMWMLEIIIRNFQLLHVINLYNLKKQKRFQKSLE